MAENIDAPHRLRQIHNCQPRLPPVHAGHSALSTLFITLTPTSNIWEYQLNMHSLLKMSTKNCFYSCFSLNRS